MFTTMQYDPNSVDNSDQHPSLNQSPYGSENVYQSYPGPPPYPQYSQQSVSDIRYTTPSAQHNDRTSLYQQQDALVVPASNLIMQNRALTIITSKLRAIFIISGIGYLLLGAGALGLEIAIIMYSSSTFYRGIWMGCIMIGAGFSMLIVACRVSHSMRHTIQLLLFVFICSGIGVAVSVLEITGIQQCTEKFFCEREIGKTLKLVMIGELNIAVFHTSVNLAFAWHTQAKTRPKPPAENDSSIQY